MLRKWVRIKIEKYFSAFRSEQSGAAGACWAHNPEVSGSKPFSARLACFSQVQRFFSCFLHLLKHPQSRNGSQKKATGDNLTTILILSSSWDRSISFALLQLYSKPIEWWQMLPNLTCLPPQLLTPSLLAWLSLRGAQKICAEPEKPYHDHGHTHFLHCWCCGLWMGWSQDKLWKESIRQRPGMMGNLHVLGGGRGGLMWFHLVLEEGTWRRKCPVGKCWVMAGQEGEEQREEEKEWKMTRKETRSTGLGRCGVWGRRPSPTETKIISASRLFGFR